MRFVKKLSNFISKYMSVIVIVVAGIALLLPWTFTWAAPKITILLGIVMFGMGMTLKVDDFRLIVERPRDVFIGALAQFTVMPTIAWVLVKIFDLPPELAVGMILVGACPGGTSSNVMTYLARGDVALSVSMTMTTTVLSPIITPCLMYLFAGEWIDIPFLSMMISIGQVVILPIMLGIIVNTLFGQFVKECVQFLPVVSITAIIIIVGGVVAVNASKLMDVGLMIGLAVMLHNMLGYCIGFVLAKVLRMDMAKAKAIAIEVGMQNSGLATSLALTHFGAAAAIPGAIFSVWHNISGSLAANYLSKRDI